MDILKLFEGVSSLVKETVAKVNFWLPVGPDTWRMARPLNREAIDRHQVYADLPAVSGP
jgi:hypothetical protein